MENSILNKLTDADFLFYYREVLSLEITEFVTHEMIRQCVCRVELAKRLGRSTAYVTRFLDGRAGFRVDDVADILTALGITVKLKRVKIEREII